MSSRPETRLALHIRERGTFCGREWAWPIADIPAVIEAVQLAHMVSVGGQLQFRFPTGTCELYWIEVDTLRAIPLGLSWREQVEQTAAIARLQFKELEKRYDFVAEGNAAFGLHLDKYRASGGDAREAMFFVWYIAAEPNG